MKNLCFAILFIFILAAPTVFASGTNTTVAQKAYLPMDLQDFLKDADEFTLFSINPEPDFQHQSTNTFQNHAILGHFDVTSAETRQKLITALDDGIGEDMKSIPPGVAVPLPDCFNPRHGIRAKKGDETVEFLICFECHQIQISSNWGKSWFFTTSSKPASVFNHVLKKAHIPLPEN